MEAVGPLGLVRFGCKLLISFFFHPEITSHVMICRKILVLQRGKKGGNCLVKGQDFIFLVVMAPRPPRWHTSRAYIYTSIAPSLFKLLLPGQPKIASYRSITRVVMFIM